MIPLTWRIGAVVLAALGLFVGVKVAERIVYQRGYNAAMQAVRLENAERTLAAVQKAVKAERELSDKITNRLKESDHEKTRIRRDLAAALASLRNRPERPASDVPTDSSNGVACTGASLFRSDAEFLVWEAARADQLRIDLQACQAAYDATREMTESGGVEK